MADTHLRPTSNRLTPLDNLRGLIIILMALDHANALIAQQHPRGEYWGGPFPAYQSPAAFLTRFVSHLSAPGFFFLMGVGMVLFATSRARKGWTGAQIRVHFLIRGLVLVGLQICLSLTRVWAVGGADIPLWYIGVLAALGLDMILSLALLDLRPKLLGWTVVILFVGMEILTPAPDLWGTNFDNLAGTMLVYGGGQGELWVAYPLLAWMEFVILGLLYGRWLHNDRGTAYRRGVLLGGAFLAVFLILRFLNGFGNIRPWTGENWISFLNLVKYPPSMAFTLLTMGINLLLLGLFAGLDPWLGGSWNPLVVFGRVPLFSYLTHLGLYTLLGRLFTPLGSSLGVMYGFWILGLAVLYFPARWYGQYKSAQSPRSWVRFI